MTKHLTRLAALLIAALILFHVAQTFLSHRNNKTQPLVSLKSWQQADAPLGYQLENGKLPLFDPRFNFLPTFERATLPVAHTLTMPMGSETGALTYNAQSFGADNPKRGGSHSGDDVNGIGGMNTDLGDPIFSIADSSVIYRGLPSPGWGNTLILAHRTPEGFIRQYMYAHLHEINATYGEFIPRSEIIGTVGTAELRYLAHLHLEQINSSTVTIGPGYSDHLGTRTAATPTIKKQLSSSSPNMTYGKSPSQIIKISQQQTLSPNIQIKSEKSL